MAQSSYTLTTRSAHIYEPFTSLVRPAVLSCVLVLCGGPP